MLNKINNNISQQDFRKMSSNEKILWLSGKFKISSSLSKEEAYSLFMKKVSNTRFPYSRAHRSTRTWILLTASVAVLIVLLCVSYFLANREIENVIAVKGQHTDCHLPDGSQVSLNADSRLTYNKSDFNKKRTVSFDGEAFFNIQKGSTFKITTHYAEIKILGTSFNVFSRDDYFSVTCYTGKVLVSRNSQKVVLLPNDVVKLINNLFEVTHNGNLYKTSSWRTGEFSFVNSPVNFIFNEIERQYNVTFVKPNLNDLYFTGSISNKNLVEALDIVCIPMGLTYEIGSNSTIIIKIKSE